MENLVFAVFHKNIERFRKTNLTSKLQNRSSYDPEHSSDVIVFREKIKYPRREREKNGRALKA